MRFRQVIFWAHLAAGIISGLAIGIMCLTGTALAFEKELIAWSERDARQIEVPAAQTPRLPLEELQRRFRQAQPDARPTSIVIQKEPMIAVAFSSGRAGNFFVDPYTGDVRQPKSSTVGHFMQTMLTWHRYLGFSGEISRPRGKWVNGVCNIAFCVLTITGLYLWMPRSWSWRAVKPVIWFHQNASSKARDFNWHNTIGFWCAPILIVLTLTAIPISFQWGGRLINQLTGTPISASATRGAVPLVEVPTPAPGARLLDQEVLLTRVQQQMPEWETITIRLGGGRTGSQAATFAVRESDTWPRTATTTLSLNPYNGEVLRRTGYVDMNAAQQVRAWTRFLHTGEALGNGGQLVAGLACLGGCFLVYTGFALSWRRFFGKRANTAPPENTV